MTVLRRDVLASLAALAGSGGSCSALAAPRPAPSAPSSPPATSATSAPRPSPASHAALVRVQLDTDWGPVVVALDPAMAPLSVAHFLAHVDRGVLRAGSFYRTVNPANDHNPATISVLQGGLGELDSPLGTVAHETTAQTGWRHTDGVLSLARGAPGSGSSEFFICLGDNPVLDFGGARNPDGQGFAAFGRVESGMPVVRRIAALPTRNDSEEAYTRGQMLAQPVKFLALRRLPGRGESR